MSFPFPLPPIMKREPSSAPATAKDNGKEIPAFSLRRPLVLSTALTGAVLAAVFAHSLHGWKPITLKDLRKGIKARSLSTETESATLQQDEAGLPQALSFEDARRYQGIFAAQRFASWQEADELIATLQDSLLLGHVLAQRYLSKNYNASYMELYAWLKNYADHPQAEALQKLAVAKRRGSDPRLPALATRMSLKGYGDDNGLSGSSNRLRLIGSDVWRGRADAYNSWRSIEGLIQGGALISAEEKLNGSAGQSLSAVEYDLLAWHLATSQLYRGNPEKAYALAAASASRSGKSLPGAHWIAGLAAWHLKDRAASARHFGAMAEAKKGLSPWEISAAAFWAHRAYQSLGKHSQANAYLAIASAHPRTFYGILARKARGESLDINQENLPELNDDDLDAIAQTPALRRSVALVQSAEADRAEQELRLIFPKGNKEMRVKMLKLASVLDLPAVQITMARALSRQGVTYDAALYPMPRWEPVNGFSVDPALVFAFARQESGFRANAKSGAGATGIMQIMPRTAAAMREYASLGHLPGESILEPETNMALGQTYLSHLMDQKTVRDNLIYLTASYNAGPGKLNEWVRTVPHGGDPLLFMETIPYAETRNYVEQVLSSYWIYQEMDGRPLASAVALAGGQWPGYNADGWAMAGETIEARAANAPQAAAEAQSRDGKKG